MNINRLLDEVYWEELDLHVANYFAAREQLIFPTLTNSFTPSLRIIIQAMHAQVGQIPFVDKGSILLSQTELFDEVSNRLKDVYKIMQDLCVPDFPRMVQHYDIGLLSNINKLTEEIKLVKNIEVLYKLYSYLKDHQKDFFDKSLTNQDVDYIVFCFRRELHRILQESN